MFPFSPSRRTRLPWSPSLSVAEDEFEIGLSLFATQTTVFSWIFLYQIPKYQPEVAPGLNKPNSKTPPAETRVWLFWRD